MDCHALLHAAGDAYMQPDDFRLQLNSLVQNLRNVTWLLQKQKGGLPNFSTWYPAWQQSVSDDEIMRWVVKARNRIVKESDLELLSTARLTFLDSWNHRTRGVVHMPPRLSIPEMIAGLRASFAQNGAPEETALVVERRWVDQRLPNHELLDACRHALLKLRDVLVIAHDATEVHECPLPTRHPPCISADLQRDMPCLQADEEQRRTALSLLDLSELRLVRETWSPDRELDEEARRRYGDLGPIYGDGPLSSVPLIFENAKRLLVTDGYHITLCWLYKGDRIVKMDQIVVQDQVDKYVTYERLGERARQLDIDGVVHVGEVWWVQLRDDENPKTGPIVPARERPDRLEGLQAFGVTRAGERVARFAPFTRDADGKITFGPTVDDAGEPMFLLPLTSHWRKDTWTPVPTPD
jgi:hypothetical protein